MAELINFIPKTLKECRELLVTLRDNPEGVSLADRNGNIDVLNASEIKSLARLTESQIGEKTPARPKADNLKKNSKKPNAKK